MINYEFRNWGRYKTNAQAKLATFESSTVFNEDDHATVRADLNEVLDKEEIFWRKKSRVTWLRDGDRATKFFMASTVTRRRRNFIQFLKNDQGLMVENLEEIAQMFIKKFSNIFSRDEDRTSMVLDDWRHLGYDSHLPVALYRTPDEEELQ